MKKRIALLFMVFTFLITNCAFAQVGQIINVDALDVLSMVDGEGYHDVAGMSFDAPQFSNNGCAILHNGDWTRYDLSSLPNGTYTLTARIANKYATNLEVKVDETLLVKSKALPSTESYSTFEEIVLEKFYLSESTSYITFRNIGSNGLYLDCFELTLLSEDNVLPIKIDAPDVVPGGQGVGYNDTSGSGTLEISGTTVCIRTGEWLAYNLSMDKASIYKMYIKAATKYGSNYDISINGETQIVNKLLEATGDYSTHKEHEIGYVVFEEGNNIIKISATSANASYFGAILFEKVVSLSCDNITGNVMSDDSLISRGSDELTFTFTNELDMDEITSSNIVISDEDGNELKHYTQFDSNRKVVKVILLDSLDYEKEYIVSLSNFIDGAGQVLDNQQISFFTGSQEDDDGLASLNDVTVTYENGYLKVSGQVVSRFGTGINGRDVVLSATKPGTDEEVIWAEVKSSFEEITSKDGMFTIEYSFPSDSDSGKYTMNLSSDYVTEEHERDIYYYDTVLNNQILDELSNVSDRDTLLSKLSLYGVYLDIDVESLQTQVEDFGYVLDGMLNKEYEKADQIVNSFYTSFYLEKINQASSETDVLVALENEETRECFGIDEAKWNLISSRQSEVVSALFEADRCTDIEVFKENINRIIDDVLLNEYSIEIPEISTDSVEVDIGQVALIDIKLKNPIENVAKIYISLKYDSDTKELYENNPIEIVNDEFEVERETENEIHTYVITSKNDSTFTAEGNVLTLKFTAANSLNGNYPYELKGYVEYHLPEMPENININSNFKNILTSGVTVKKTEIKDYYGSDSGVGKGYGSSGFGGSSSSVSLPVVTPPKTEVPKEDTEETFVDLDNVSWAKESILYLADKGIVNGKEKGLFKPDDLCSRAEICKMLSLALELSEESGEFVDVSADDWYSSYVRKMANAQIIYGYEDGSFAPNSYITREDLAVIAKRALEYKNVKMPESYGEFEDHHLINQYAKDSVGLMREIGILKGVGNNIFNPKSNVTRAMAAKVIYSILNY